jgi:hypothetical protein
MSDRSDKAGPSDTPPPVMFDYPSDAPPPLTPLRGGAEITRIHDYWTRLDSPVTDTRSPTVNRLVRRGRRIALRALGRSDHDFLADLTRSIDAVAARCDELAEQLARQQHLAETLARTLGEEVTRLRALVERPSGSSPR